MSTSLKRLTKLFKKQNLAVSKDGAVYRIQNIGVPGAPISEVLLPERYNLDLKAVKQLMSFAGVAHPNGGEVRAAVATPDFHAGSSVPVGAVVATSRDMIIPQAIGTDIHCGMRLHAMDIDITDWQSKKTELVEKLRGDLLLGTRNLPMQPRSFHELFNNGLAGWVRSAKLKPMGDFIETDFVQLENELGCVYSGGSEEGHAKWAPESLVNLERSVIRDSSLATIGGGNHFVEFQIVDEILDRKRAFQLGVKKGQISIMIHTGSRAVGMHVGNYWIDKARENWPSTYKYPSSKIFPLYGNRATEYLEAMNTAANYANLNRLLLAELVRKRVREVFGKGIEMPLIHDAPHNIVTEESGCFIHRKGATPAHFGEPVLIPGSMGHPSYLMMGLGNQRFLNSASHGAGRDKSRHDMFCRNKAGEDLGLTCVDCITLKEDRRIEEAPAAYKDIDEVVEVQVQNKIVSPVAKLKPMLTFKG
ncbi:RtcB family protein [Teredinibacter sp. KSP-S5-2]|uniref:RtcB family protein n=1 Tax=Teredinibacter sp. KSP-S5-2 TaxID=3034506 RepID=UPI002934BFB2|nr:RtcB family protein [Teredinibacter sp. KSP-S5-2]WNO10873.1 RtcB family protein [Teredinibacter sp. KSP-S5-2]